MNLDLATSDELVEELKRRYDTLVFAVSHSTVKDRIGEWYCGHGDWLKQLGLVKGLEHHCLTEERGEQSVDWI